MGAGGSWWGGEGGGGDRGCGRGGGDLRKVRRANGFVKFSDTRC